MSQQNHPSSPRFVVHGAGAGEFSDQDLERRAREIALIDGRPEPTDTDRARARDELLNRDLPPTVSEDADTTSSLSRDPSDPVAVHGHQTPNYNEPNEQQVIEQLATEGVEEAQHDQMVEARRKEIRDGRRGRV